MNPIISLSQIETATKVFAKHHSNLAETLKVVTDQIEAVKRKHMALLKRDVTELAAAQAELKALIELAPGLFEKPRTYTFHGIKIGLTKKKGTIEISNPEKTVLLIEKHLPDKADILINTTKTPLKKALGSLTVEQLKKIACEVTKDTDAVFISPTDGEIEKAVAALLKDATEDLEQQAAA